MCYLERHFGVIYQINSDIPVTGFGWLLPKDHHLHSLLVIFSWNSKGCHFETLSKHWQRQPGVVMFCLHLGIRIHFFNISPLFTFLTLIEMWPAFNRNIPVVSPYHQTAVFHQNGLRRNAPILNYYVTATYHHCCQR